MSKASPMRETTAMQTARIVALEKAKKRRIDASWVISQEFAPDGTWIPRPAPSWGGVVHCRCRTCQTSFPVFLEHKSLFNPTLCRTCAMRIRNAETLANA